jgi:preprotein translocase subunit SecA
MIGESIEDAVGKYVTEDYIAACIAEWARVNFEVNIDVDDLKGIRHIEELEHFIKAKARTEIETSLSSTLAEFMGEDPDDLAQWDMKSLQSWAMSRFHVQLSQTQMKKLDAHQLEEHLTLAAMEQIEQRDCAGLMKYLEANFALKELCAWAQAKFGVAIKPEELLVDTERGTTRAAPEIVELIEQRARDAYHVREIEYPVDTVLMMVFGPEARDADNPYAAEHLKNWAWSKFRIELPLEKIQGQSVRKLREELVAIQKSLMEGGKLETEVDELIKSNSDRSSLATAANQRFMTNLIAKDLDGERSGDEHDVREVLVTRGRQFLRRELTELEQFVLIQIFDQSWKDHLYAMDMLKAGIGLQAFAEQDPRIAYKREGFRYFQEMMSGVRDKVTDLIFRARVVGGVQARNAYQVTATTHETTNSYGVSETVAATAETQPAPQQDAAAAPQGEAPAKVKTIVRNVPKVGRNDPCPCGSGKKYKKCHGINAA